MKLTFYWVGLVIGVLLFVADVNSPRGDAVPLGAYLVAVASILAAGMTRESSAASGRVWEERNFLKVHALLGDGPMPLRDLVDKLQEGDFEGNEPAQQRLVGRMIEEGYLTVSQGVVSQSDGGSELGV